MALFIQLSHPCMFRIGKLKYFDVFVILSDEQDIQRHTTRPLMLSPHLICIQHPMLINLFMLYDLRLPMCCRNMNIRVFIVYIIL